MSTRPFRLLVVPLTLIVGLIAGCASAAPPSGSPGASQPPGSSAKPDASSTGGIGYPTGATDIVLRMSDGGGFMMAEYVATNGPIFTLYGDRTVVFRDVTQAPPEVEAPFRPNVPYRIAKLSEDQVQELLDFALNQGALGIARERYDHPLVADASTVTFEIHVTGLDKTVDVVALGEDPSAPDQVMRASMSKVAERLRSFDQGGTIDVPLYEPTAYRGFLFEAGPVEGVEFREWPFEAVTADDFETPLNDPDVPSLPTRLFTAAEVDALGIDGIEGGVMGIYLTAPDGKRFSFALRPLLPDEER